MLFQFLMKLMKKKKLLPKISETEKEALEAGTVWIEQEFFKGSLNFQEIFKEPYLKLPKEEQEFLDGPVETLCQMIDGYKIAKTKCVPEKVIAFIKEQGFMGLLVPKEYGGKQFSSLGISSVIHKVMPRSAVIGIILIIPNSLGAAELLIHYGTEEQKKNYLPKLAKGEYIPCFALTEPGAGSDAAAIQSSGIVFKDQNGALKIRLNFEKRYASLAPVANLISVAFKLQDPENFLGKGKDVGITVAMIAKNTPGVEIGGHHEPIGEPFYNGPIHGKDVVIDLNQIIGGLDYAGKGWKMLMEQLSGGRAISLPGSAVGTMKNVALLTGAYAEIRSQFNIPLAKMEAISEKLAKMAALTYAFDATRIFACSAIDSGKKPPVVSAILKAYSTEEARSMLIDGMDIFAGSGVMQGPKNVLGRGFAASPIGITVEGANIMTRSFIIFGQGATRCHPYAYQLIQAVEKENLPLFRKTALAWIGNFFFGIVKKSIRTLTRGYTVKPLKHDFTAKYYRKLGWSASRFAMLSNLAIFTMGGALKAKGSLTGRFADVLAWQLIAVSILRRYEAEKKEKELVPVIEYALEYAMHRIQTAFEEIYRNFDVPLIGFWMRTIGSSLLRLNPIGSSPKDSLQKQAAAILNEFHPALCSLVTDIYLPDKQEEGAGLLLHTFKLQSAAKPTLGKIIEAQKKQKIPRGIPERFAEEALKLGIIDEKESQLLKELCEAKQLAIQVDAFSPEDFFQNDAMKIAPGFISV